MSGTPISNPTEANLSPELMELWAAALLSRDSVGVENIVSIARHIPHPSSSLIGD
jgi:hypothetical protein